MNNSKSETIVIDYEHVLADIVLRDNRFEKNCNN